MEILFEIVKKKKKIYSNSVLYSRGSDFIPFEFYLILIVSYEISFFHNFVFVVVVVVYFVRSAKDVMHAKVWMFYKSMKIGFDSYVSKCEWFCHNTQPKTTKKKISKNNMMS